MPTQVRRSSPSTPPGATSGGHTDHLAAHGGHLTRGRRRQAHAAELEHVEAVAVPADTTLAEQHGPGGADPCGQRQRPQQGSQHDQQEAGQHAVEHVLDGELPALGVDRAQAEQRQAAQVLQRQMHVHALEEARDERDLHAEGLAAAHHRQDLAVGPGQEAEDHMPGAGLGDHALQVVGGAQHGCRALGHHLVRRRVGVQVSHRPQPQSRLGGQPHLHVGADHARADDQRGGRPPGPPGGRGPGPSAAAGGCRPGRASRTASRAPAGVPAGWRAR